MKKKIKIVDNGLEMLSRYEGVNGMRADKSGELILTCFNLGKADAIFIKAEEETVLIDAGLDDKVEEVLDFFTEHKITTLDYLVITHFDKDHVGGASKILRNLKVKNVLQSYYEKDSLFYRNYLNALSEKDIKPLNVLSKLSFSLGDAVFTVYPPSHKGYKEKESNNSSLVLRAVHGKNSFLFTGDAMDERLLELMTSYEVESSFLKVPYHGRYLVTLPEFFSRVKAEHAVITSSDSRPEDIRTIEALNNVGTKIYLTRRGKIICHSNGIKLDITQASLWHSA